MHHCRARFRKPFRCAMTSGRCCSLGCLDFFSVQLQLLQRPANRGRTGAHLTLLLKSALQFVQGDIGLSGDHFLQRCFVFFQNGDLAAAVGQCITAARGTPAMQEFFYSRDTDSEFFCDFGLRVITVILKKPDNSGTEIVREWFRHIRHHPDLSRKRK